MKSHLLNRLLACALVTSLAACGGGGGGSSSAPALPSLSGIAATGAPLNSAEVSITDVDGTQSVSTDANGLFTLPITGVKAPAILKVTLSDGRYLMSIWDGTMRGESATTNITPLTDAIVSVYAKTGSLEPASISKETLSSAKAEVFEWVREAIEKSGLDPDTFDLMGTPFRANGAGLDAVLDSLTFERSASGETLLFPKQLVLDSGASPKQPQPLSKNARLSNVVSQQNVLNTSMLNAWRTRMNSCMLVEVSNRAGSSNCAGLYPTGYKNDGVNFATDFYGETGEANSVGAVFETPNILSVSPDADSKNIAIVEMKWFQPRTGTLHSRVTVFKDLGSNLQGNNVASATGTSWWLYGNQSNYEIRLEPRVTRYENLNNDARSQAVSPSNITYGLHILINEKSPGANPDIRSAVVSGPGLPEKGLVLAPVDKTKFSSNYLGILNADGMVPVAGTSAKTDVNEYRIAAESLDNNPVNTTNVANWWKLQGETNPDFSTSTVGYSSFSAQTAYTVTLYFNNNKPSLEVSTRLRGSLKNLKDVRVVWPEFVNKQGIENLMRNSSSEISFNWHVADDALRSDSAFVNAISPTAIAPTAPNLSCEKAPRWGASTLVNTKKANTNNELSVTFKSDPIAGNCQSTMFPASSMESFLSIGIKALQNGVRYYSIVTWRPNPPTP